MKATDTFRTAPWCHNCAQAIAHRWAALFPGRDIVADYAPYRGGKAPQGYCGALYAAMQACPEHAGEILDEFAAIAGDTHCHIIKQKGHTPCEKCVDTADSLIEKYGDIS